MRGDERKHQRKTVRVRQLVLGARASPEGIKGKAKVYQLELQAQAGSKSR